jgi:hypothetical protein
MQSSSFLRVVVFVAILASSRALPVAAQNPPLGGIQCQDVEQNGLSVFDPEGDVVGAGGACPNPVNSGFDAGTTSMWLHPDGHLFFCSELHGNIGDSDQDGGYHTEAAVCGGHPVCVGQETDVFGNVIASGAERIIWYVDRDFDGDFDLIFKLDGSTEQRADSVRVTLDILSGHASLAGLLLGGRGVAWQASPVQRINDVVCVPDRHSALIMRIPDWRRYFTVDGEVNGELVSGMATDYFRWQFFLGNDTDFYTDDSVSGAVSDVPESFLRPGSGLQVRPPHPNPFRRAVRITVDLNATSGAVIHAEVFDLSGRLLRDLGDHFVGPSGSHEFQWDGRNDSGSRLASGIYILRFDSAIGRRFSRVALMD